MNYHNASGICIGSCSPDPNSCQKSPWYCKFIKPLFSFVVSVLLALAVSHINDIYSSGNTYQILKSDISSLKNNLNHLRTTIERNSEKLLEIVSSDSVTKAIRKELETYDADKTGKTDYALETSGGLILSTRDTENFHEGAPYLMLFGIPLCRQENTPRAIIQKGVLPGECWAFKGSAGSVVIKLIGSVRISEVSIEHISSDISPTGETTTAPKDFSVFGLSDVDDKNGFLLGTYTYDNCGPLVQYFKIQNNPNRNYEIVELKVHSNHGNKNFTCIYRFRVHGTCASIPNMIN